MIRNGEIQDAKTLVALLFVECFRRKATTRGYWLLAMHSRPDALVAPAHSCTLIANS